MFRFSFDLRCEFLSIWYIYQSNYNLKKEQRLLEAVVSSFQFGIFIKVITTQRGRHRHSGPL